MCWWNLACFMGGSSVTGLVWMSWSSFFNAWVAMIGLVSFFTWNMWGVLLAVLLLIVSVVTVMGEVNMFNSRRFVNGFWLFIFSEAALFCCFFASGLWFEDEFSVRISPFIELPLLGCTLLIGSSVYVSSFHYNIGEGNVGVYDLLCGVVLGVLFICMQFYEFYGSVTGLVSNPYDASSLITVGLHFSHVLLGLVVLGVVCWLYAYSGGLGLVYYMDLGVWYWHFVDYVWLAVCVFYYW